jgi:phosphoribosylformylglycinamidine synthase
VTFSIHSVTQTITSFEGAHALGPFRARQLLERLQSLNDRVARLDARYVHLVWSDQAVGAAAAATGSTARLRRALYRATEGALVVVTPRLGTVSPWASKATDIAHNCGLDGAPDRAHRRIPDRPEVRLARAQPADARAIAGAGGCIA